MMARSLLIGLAIGIAIGLLVAAPITFMEWQANPGGVYQNAQGTRWDHVGETLWSWFWPFALLATPIAVAVIAWRLRKAASMDKAGSQPAASHRVHVIRRQK